MKAIGYTRVSTEEQSASGLGLEDQRLRIGQEAERRDWTVRWVEDAGFSAKDLKRPGISSALDALRCGEADVLVVSKLDRLSRSLIDFAGLMELARKEGWSLVALDLGVDMSTPSGQLVASVMASFAEYERKLIGQRTRDALAVLKAKGVRLGRPPLVPPAVVEQIQRWRQHGSSYQGCADALNAAGVPTLHGGQQWRASTVRSIALAAQRRAVPQ